MRYLQIFIIFSFASCSLVKDDIDVKTDLTFDRFRLVPASSSRIYFGNYVSETNDLNIVSYEYLYNGGGVGIGDFNNDGLEDIYFTGTMVPDKLYLNEENLKFRDHTAASNIISNLGFKTGVSVIDINNDGYQDIYVTRTGKGNQLDRTNLLFINKGNAVFEESSEKYGLNSASHSNHSYFFDFDGDGDLDVYILNHPVDFQNSQEVRVRPDKEGGFERIVDAKTIYDSDQLFQNNGDGTFSDISKEAGINNSAYGLSAAIGDFNGDQRPDIFVANDYLEPDLLYINKGDGTFEDKITEFFDHTSQNSMGSDFADINNDGLSDLIVVDMIAEDQKRQKSLMTSMLYERHQMLIQLGYQNQQMRNILQLNNGKGKGYSEIAQFSGISNTDWSWAPLISDLDNDGWKDIFISNGYKRDLTNCDFTIYKSDSLKKSKQTNIYDYLNTIPSTPVRNYLFKNRNGLLFENVSESWGLKKTSFSNGAAYADLDNDGDLDLVTNNLDGSAFLYQNMSELDSNNHYIRIKLRYTNENIDGIGSKVMVKVNGQWQYQDLMMGRGYFSSTEKYLHFGTGKAKHIDSLNIVWPNFQISSLSGLLTDSVYNIKYQTSSTHPKINNLVNNSDNQFSLEEHIIHFIHKENPYEDFLSEPFIPHRLSDLGPRVSTADVDGDGLVDLFIGGSINSPSKIYLNKGKKFIRTNQRILELDSAYEDGTSVFFDIDKDGDLDLFVASSGNEYEKGQGYQDRIYLNDGEGNFTSKSKYIGNIENSTYSTLAFDFDLDGDSDIMSFGRVEPHSYPSKPKSFLFENKDGILVDVTDKIFPQIKDLGMITDVIWVDIDGDGHKELVVAGEWLPIVIYCYESNKFKQVDITGLDWYGWWNKIEVVDIDRDGDLDIIAGNLGLNSKYKASKNRPFSVYSKDFDGNGSIDPILCQFIGDKSWPIPQKNTVTKNIPYLQSKLAKYETYSKSSISDIFSKTELDNALYLEVHTFDNSIFINNDNESFSRKALPDLAQLSPIYAIISHDFNQDGFIDLFLGGNKYGTEVERGPYDASRGLVLYGDSGADFKNHTLLNVKGEIRDAKLVSLGDVEYLLIFRNNDSALTFKF